MITSNLSSLFIIFYTKPLCRIRASGSGSRPRNSRKTCEGETPPPRLRTVSRNLRPTARTSSSLSRPASSKAPKASKEKSQKSDKTPKSFKPSKGQKESKEKTPKALKASRSKSPKSVDISPKVPKTTRSKSPLASRSASPKGLKDVYYIDIHGILSQIFIRQQSSKSSIVKLCKPFFALIFTTLLHYKHDDLLSNYYSIAFY